MGTKLLHRLFSVYGQSVALTYVVASIPLLIAVGNCVKKLIQLPPLSDRLGNLGTFRDASLALTNGTDIYTSGIGQYLYPPLLAFLGQPMNLMSLRMAGILVLIINIAMAVLAVLLLTSICTKRIASHATPIIVARVTLIGVWLSCDSIRTEFNQWETNVLMLLMFVLALQWIDRRPVLAGIALGVAFNIKFLPVVFVPLLLIDKRWKLLASFAFSAVVLTFLPAVTMGLPANLAAVIKSYGGILRLFGLQVPSTDSSHVFAFTNLRSISVPSSIGRMTGLSQMPSLAIAGFIAAAVIAFWISTIHKTSNFKLNQRPPDTIAICGRRAFAIQWIVVILFALIFSPYTNSGHLFLLLAVNIAAATLFLAPLPAVRPLPIAAAALLMFLGHILPPGINALQSTDRFWRFIGGQGWCMLAFCIIVMLSGVAYIARKPPSASTLVPTDAS